MNPTQSIHQDSGNPEWYTKAHIIDAARATMGRIDLDPASCAAANLTVKAVEYFTQADDGLSVPWFGNVWLNHPYSKGEEICKPNCRKKRCHDPKKRGHCITVRIPANDEWIHKLVSEYKAGNVKQACCIVYASTSEQWFQPLFGYPICFRNERERFTPGSGQHESSPGKGSAVIYLGGKIDRFVRYFSPLGSIMVPYQITALAGTLCPICEHRFTPKRADTIYCSAACNQKAKRQRIKQSSPPT